MADSHNFDYQQPAGKVWRLIVAELRHQIPINAPTDRVYGAVATENGMRSWWTADTTVGDHVGAEAEFGFDGRQMVFRMKIEKLDPGQRVVMSCHGDHPEWDGTMLTWDISGEDGTTKLRFTHSGWKSATEFFAMCNSTWGELMYRLKYYLEGKNPGPHWTK
jgi:uncharacterized protein YndB with AHSA1/START domain